MPTSVEIVRDARDWLALVSTIVAAVGALAALLVALRAARASVCATEAAQETVRLAREQADRMVRGGRTLRHRGPSGPDHRNEDLALPQQVGQGGRGAARWRLRVTC
jgi:hypothetical protein